MHSTNTALTLILAAITSTDICDEEPRTVRLIFDLLANWPWSLESASAEQHESRMIMTVTVRRMASSQTSHSW